MSDDLLVANDSLTCRTRAFHAHLDGCTACAVNPFGLCPVGRVLFMATALKDVSPLRGLNMEVS